MRARPLPADLGAAIIAVAADAIISVDDTQRIVQFNQGAEQIFGYSADEIIGRPLDVLIPSEFVAAHRQHLKDFAASAVTARPMRERGRGISGIRKNGEQFPAEASILKTRTPNGWLFTAVLRDVTDRRRAEEEQQRLLDEAVRASRARDDVLGVVSHDLRNPLSVVRMCVTTLLEHPTPTPELMRELITGMAQSVDWMERLIQDLLDVTSIEAGRLSIERRVIGAGQLLAEATALARPLVVDSGLHLSVDAAPSLAEVYADPDRVLQVFANLLGNAVKFTPRGGRLTVSAYNDDETVTFAVSDTGPGIPERDVRHLFDRYWQARRTARQQGTGLGLAIARGIVEAHGGRIWVVSQVGLGSTFYFTLPLHRAV